MTAEQIATRQGQTVRLEDTVVDGLTLRGEVLRPGDEDYDAARAVWNATVDRRPAVIARCLGVADVLTTVNVAREHDLRVSVRGGGHSVAGNAVCDGGLMIDLSPMRWVRVDPARRRAHVGPGATLGDFDQEAQAFGLATPLGIMSDTGVAGLTLGGGFGVLSLKYGLTIDNLVSADMVTADGRLVHASAEENPDLFWGLRGGGGNFGIVTNFDFQLHPVGPTVLGGPVFYHGDDAPTVLRQLRDIVGETPDEQAAAAVTRLAPPAPFLPDELHGRPVIIVLAFHCGPLEQAHRDLQPLRQLAPPAADLIEPRRYVDFQRLLDPNQQPGYGNYWKAEYLTGLPDEAIDVLADGLQRTTSSLSDVKIIPLGREIARVGEDDTAYSHRDAPFIVNINGRWDPHDDPEPHIAWTRQLWDALQPWSHGGGYINFMEADEAQDRIRAAYGDATYQRLVDLKHTYDPTNLFQLNHNIVSQPQPEAVHETGADSAGTLGGTGADEHRLGGPPRAKS